MGALFFLVAYAWPHAAAAETLEARFLPPAAQAARRRRPPL
jgi:hypothetical protein